MESPQKAHLSMLDGTYPDFVWQDYLDDTNTEAVAAVAFTHVENSLESVFKVGMKLEIPNPDDKTTYWLASVIMICGDLLLLRYAGYGEDRSGDIWINVKVNEFHPAGWCSSNRKEMCPPKSILERHSDVNAILSKDLNNTETIPTLLSENLNGGFMPIDQINCGMKLEVEEIYNSQKVWIASIIQNVGGRLLLRYDGSKENLNRDIWLFYLDYRLHPVGYAEDNGIQYDPPEDLKQQCSEKEWVAILKQSLKEAKENPFPAHILEPKIPLEKHLFENGMKLEAVDTRNFTDICPATVTGIIDNYHFLITLDTYKEEESKCIILCNSNYPFVFPIKWAEENGLCIKIPLGYEEANSKFSWDNYLQFCNAKAATPELFPMCFMNLGFDVGLKLEAADPFHLETIKAATVVKVVDPLIWIHFDNEESEEKNFISSVNSLNIFPVGWCASNTYPLQTPLVSKTKAKTSVVLDEVEENAQRSSQEVPIPTPVGQQCKSWCPKIYFNHRCFTGPLLSKSKLAELPQAIGPGPLHLVIQDVIYRVVNIAYKSSRVLQILQINGKPTPGMQQQIIKAKYKGKTNRATIEVIRNSEQVEEFCKNICLKLECCSYLFGPRHVGETCPSNCHTQTKTKFGYNFVKKQKKVGRPPSSTSNMVSSDNGDAIKRGPGRRKKRKHWKHLNNTMKEAGPPEEKAASRDSSETDDASKCDSREKSPQLPRIPLIGKKKFKHTPSSSIVTRGAKLPNFGLWHHVSPFHSRRGRPRTRPIRPPLFPPRKVGRPLGSTKKAAMAARRREEETTDVSRSPTPPIDDNEEMSDAELPKPSLLESNPLEWTVEDVVQYLQKTDYAPLAPLLKEQEIDGQALLMLNLFNVQEYLHLKPEPAEKFCYLIKNLKVEFFTHYVT